jgi:hypothetical protein
MTSPVERLQALTVAAREASHRRAVAEAARDRAKTDAADAIEKLREQYGVNSIEEAKALEAKLEAELDELVTKAEEKLQEASQ